MINLFLRPVVGGGTFYPVAPVPGPEQKNCLCQPLVSMIKYVTFE